MHHLKTCLPVAEADRVLCRHFVMFLSYSWLVCLLGFCLRNAPLVKVIRNPISFRFSPCWCVRGLLRFKEFWPYLMAFRSCISTCAPEYSHCKFGACEKWEPAGHINDFGNFLNGFANSPFLPCIPHRSGLFWLNSTDIVEFSSWKRFIMLSIL